MPFATKPRPLLALAALAVTFSPVTAHAAAGDCFFAYTPPLPDMHTAVAAVDHVRLATVCAGFLLAACAAVFLPGYGAKRAASAPAAPAAPASFGPIYCPRSRRWRDPSTGRLVKAPRV